MWLLIFRRDLVTSHIAMCPSASLRSVCPPWPALDVRHQWTQIILYRRLYRLYWGICGGQVTFQEVDLDVWIMTGIHMVRFDWDVSPVDLDSMAMKNQWVHWPLESPGHPWQIRMEQRQQMKPAASKCQNTNFRMLVMTVMKIQLYDCTPKGFPISRPVAIWVPSHANDVFVEHRRYGRFILCKWEYLQHFRIVRKQIKKEIRVVKPHQNAHNHK